MLAVHPLQPPPPAADASHRAIAMPAAPTRHRQPVTDRLASLAIPPPAMTEARPFSTMASSVPTSVSGSRTAPLTRTAPTAATSTLATTSTAAAPAPHPHPPSALSAPSSSNSTPSEPTPTPITPTAAPAPFDIHSYPSTELLRLLASLLTQIASTNDKLASAPSPAPSSASQHHGVIWATLLTASRGALMSPTSALTFHARNVPTISLESYLLRILKYCPTTNEVFLSLLVYFDRMSKLAGDATGRTFVIDSYNVHRLVIAGVTVASKFFSDVFYTNSRYAKVGGLPQAELNQLELQFLLLNDFRLVISSEEMQRYAEQLIVFSEGSLPPTSPSPSPSPSPSLAPTSPSPSSPNAKTNGMHAMGAIDAYGGSVAPTASTSGTKTPSARPPGPARNPSEDDDAASEAGTETETEGGWTTDDEPTIRAGGAADRSDCASLCSTQTDEGDRDGDGFFAGDEGDVEVEDSEAQTRVGGGGGTPGARAGERTPEQRGVRREGEGSAGGDFAMASP
ncbi:hypothetical protein HWV62_29062 [Athelia sp. TMB]|nr:hypothetical protein HWV62_29062 [Athelia sp. TMB]